MINEKSLKNLKPIQKGQRLGIGRPKGSQNKLTIYNRLINEKITVGDVKKTRYEAILETFFNKAIKGDNVCLLEVIKRELGEKPSNSTNTLIQIITEIQNKSDDEIRTRVIK